jgi:hypothetical protein
MTAPVAEIFLRIIKLLQKSPTNHSRMARNGVEVEREVFLVSGLSFGVFPRKEV